MDDLTFEPAYTYDGEDMKVVWKMGDNCSAIYEEDGFYYPAKVIQIQEWTNTSIVRFNDYGNEEEIPFSNMKLIETTEKFTGTIEEDEKQILFYPQWLKMGEGNGRIVDNEEKMEKHCNPREDGHLEALLNELIEMYEGYTKISKAQSFDNQVINQDYKRYKIMEKSFKELLQELNENPEVLRTRDKFYGWIKTRDNNEVMSEQIQDERKENWNRFDTITNETYRTIQIVQQGKYCLKDTDYIFLQHILEKCHSHLVTINLKGDGELRESKRDLAHNISQTLDILDAWAMGKLQRQNFGKSQ